jgi:hypothetical protein
MFIMKIENFRLYSHIELKLMDQFSIYKKFQLHILEFSEVQDNKMLEKTMKQRIPIMFLFALRERHIAATLGPLSHFL